MRKPRKVRGRKALGSDLPALMFDVMDKVSRLCGEKVGPAICVLPTSKMELRPINSD